MLPFVVPSWASKLTFFFLLEDRAALDEMPFSEDGEVWGVCKSVLAAITLDTGSFVPKGSLRKSRTSSLFGSAASISLGGVGGRTDRDSNLELENTMAMLENNHARAKRESGLSAVMAQQQETCRRTALVVVDTGLPMLKWLADARRLHVQVASCSASPGFQRRRLLSTCRARLGLKLNSPAALRIRSLHMHATIYSPRSR